MECGTCGSKVDEGCNFCPRCGSPLGDGPPAASATPPGATPPPPEGYPATRMVVNSPLAIAALAVGIFSVIFFWGPLAGIVISAAGIVLGALGMKQVNDNPGVYVGKSMAVAGLVLSLIGGAFSLTLHGFWIRSLWW